MKWEYRDYATDADVDCREVRCALVAVGENDRYVCRPTEHGHTFRPLGFNIHPKASTGQYALYEDDGTGTGIKLGDFTTIKDAQLAAELYDMSPTGYEAVAFGGYIDGMEVK